jgi:hypothetical protein
MLVGDSKTDDNIVIYNKTSLGNTSFSDTELTDDEERDVKMDALEILLRNIENNSLDFLYTENKKKEKKIKVNDHESVEDDEKKQVLGLDSKILVLDNDNNPYFIGIDGGHIINIKEYGLLTKYKSVLLLCITDQPDICTLHLISNVLNNSLSKYDNLMKINKFLVLIRAPIELLRNKQHKFMCNIVKQQYLNIFNHNNLVLDEDELVILMPNINQDQTKIYISLYQNYTIEEELTNKIVLDFYKNEDKNVLEEISRRILFSKDTDYWTVYKNCKINMSNLFNARSCSYVSFTAHQRKQKMNMHNSGGLGDIDDNNISEFITDNSISNYEHVVATKRRYIDPSITNMYNYEKVYEITQPTITNDDFLRLFNMCTIEYDVYNLVCAILISKNNCHLVINNYDVLNILQPFFNKYAPILNNIMGYVWIVMYMEECITKTKTVTTSRYVYKLSTANKLPFYPYTSADAHNNPYLPILVSNEKLISDKNLWGLKMIKGYKHYGIANMAEFKRHFNIFCTGKYDKNLFEGCDWTNVAASGSFMTACLQKRSPLIDAYNVNGNCNDDKLYELMFADEYKTSDIDVIICSEDAFKFIDKVRHIYSVVKKNVKELNKKSNVSLESFKTLFIEVHIDYFVKLGFTKQYIMDNLDTNEIREIIYGIYYKIKIKHNKNNRDTIQNNAYEAFYNPVDYSDMKLKITYNGIIEFENDIKNNNDNSISFRQYIKQNELKNIINNPESNPVYIMISEGLKYRIHASSMLHPIELFPITNNEPFFIVSKFHMCNVRAYYVGETKSSPEEVYMLPSLITSMLTYMNLDIKYVTGKQCSPEIILKNLSRGYGLFINSDEKKQIEKYCKFDKKWNALLGSVKMQTNYGGLMINNSLLHPSCWNENDKKIKKAHIINTSHVYINTVAEYYDEWKNRYNYDPSEHPIDLLKLKCINKNGYIIPIDRTYIKQAYSILNTTSPYTMKTSIDKSPCKVISGE